jgi:3-hydroxybutyryl-CoA dehydratase
MPNPMRLKAIEGLKAGDSFTYERTFSREETELFGDMTRDYNPVHYDHRWTEVKGFNGLICHGLLVGSMICEFGGQVGWLATGMTFKYIKPVYFGDTITCEITLNAIDDSGRAEAEAIFTNEDGDQVCFAQLTGRLPLAREREILNQMVSERDPTNKLSEIEFETEPEAEPEKRSADLVSQECSVGVKFDSLERAFMFVNSGADLTHQAILCRKTGKIHHISDALSFEDEIPPEKYEDEDCIEIPGKNFLDLGHRLVFDFVEEYLPGQSDRVRNIFRSRGAYGRFKDLLDNHGLLKQWQKFEDIREAEALREWCRQNDIVLVD